MRSPCVSQCISGLLMCKSWQCWLPTIFRLVMLLQISLVCRTLGSNQDQWCDRGNFVKPPCQQQKLQIWPECISKRYASYWNVCWPSFLRNMYSIHLYLWTWFKTRFNFETIFKHVQKSHAFFALVYKVL